jgi:hypothetical protein
VAVAATEAAGTPERASLPRTARSFVAGSNWRAAPGAVLSSLTVSVRAASWLSALSVERNWRVWVPSVRIAIGAV